MRTREIGIRLALGARPAAVVRMVTRDGMALVAIGALAGLGAAAALARVLRSVLAEVGAVDPAAYAGGLAVLALAFRPRVCGPRPARFAGRCRRRAAIGIAKVLLERAAGGRQTRIACSPIC
jgi:ABC-type antimicrobial peptide transport system permease subunit